MTRFIVLDGKQTELIEVSKSDIKATNNFSGYGQVAGNVGIPPPPTEIGDALKHLNMDTLDPNTRMTTIDMNSRLHTLEISAILTLDLLASMHVIPHQSLTLTRQKKRLSVSEGGLGRQEVVSIASGMRGDQMGKGFFGRLHDVFIPPKV